MPLFTEIRDTRYESLGRFDLARIITNERLDQDAGVDGARACVA